MKKVLLIIMCLLTIGMSAQKWEFMYELSETTRLIGGCDTDEGNFVFGYFSDYGTPETNAYALYANMDGSYIGKSFVFDGCNSMLCRGIGLDNGNAFVVGLKGSSDNYKIYDTLWVSIMTPELEIVEEHNYPIEAPYKTWTYNVYMDYNNYGEIMVLAHVSERTNEWMTTVGVDVILRCDTSGNILQSRYYSDGQPAGGAMPTDIIRVPGTDNMMFLGKGFKTTGRHSICMIDNELNLISSYEIPINEDNWNHVDCWKDENHFLMSSQSYHGGGASYCASIFEVDMEGHYIDTLVYNHSNFDDYTALFGSMAYVNDETIYIATYHEAGIADLQSEAYILLIDNDLNLKGVKMIEYEDMKVRIYDIQTTSDGGCLIYGNCKKIGGLECIAVWKLMPEDFEIQWTVSPMSEASQHYDVFPNPTSDMLNIVLNDDNQSVRVSISDLGGRKYFERKMENESGLLEIDVSLLKAGTYFYEVVAGNKQIEKGKFIKN